MKEPAPIPILCLHGHESRRAQRVLVLTALKGICLQIGKLQRSAKGRLACREVARMLDAALAAETAGLPERRR